MQEFCRVRFARMTGGVEKKKKNTFDVSQCLQIALTYLKETAKSCFFCFVFLLFSFIKQTC